MLTCSGVNDDLSLVTVSPAVENTLSDGVDVAGTHKNRLAIICIKGKRCS